MKKIGIGEANQNFSQLIKIVDREKEVALTKHNNEVYVIMTKDRYLERMVIMEIKNKIKEGMWACTTENEKLNSIIFMKEEEGRLRLAAIDMKENQATGFTEVVAPMEDVEIDPEPLKIKINPGPNTGERMRGAWSMKEGDEGYEDFQGLLTKAPKDLEIIELVLPHEV